MPDASGLRSRPRQGLGKSGRQKARFGSGSLMQRLFPSAVEYIVRWRAKIYFREPRSDNEEFRMFACALLKAESR